MADTSVRLARTSDVDDLASVQIRAWTSDFAQVLPTEALAALTSLGAFAGEPSPLIDCGTAGDQYGDVVSGRHEVIE